MEDEEIRTAINLMIETMLKSLGKLEKIVELLEDQKQYQNQ